MKKDYIYMLLIVIAFLFGFFKCSNYRTKDVIKVKEETITKVRTHIKTVPFNLPIPKVTYATIYKPIYDTIKKSNIYTSNITDSLIQGKIISEIKDCKLINQKLEYKPLFPKYVYRTDSVFTTTTITKEIRNNYWSIYGGFNFTAPKYLGIYPTIGLKTKSDRYIELGYDPFNKNFQIGLKIKIISK